MKPVVLFSLILLLSILILPSSWIHRCRAWACGAEYLGDESVRFQSGEFTCGPASLSMVYELRGLHVSEKEIIDSLPISRNGTTMFDLFQHARKLGLPVMGERLSFKELKICSFPVILFVHGGHFVVGDSISGGEVYLRDPALGRVRYAELSFQKIWHGETLVFPTK